MVNLSRREFVTGVAAAAVGAGLECTDEATGTTQPAETAALAPVKLHYLDRPALPSECVTGTIPWPKGSLKPGIPVHVTDSAGNPVSVQTVPLAYWPEGSIKWTSHTLMPGTSPTTGFSVVPGELTPGQPGDRPLVVSESTTAITVDTGLIRCTIPRSGALLIENVQRAGRPTLAAGRLVCQVQDLPEGGTVQSFQSVVDHISIESAGPISTGIKIEGSHRSDSGRSVLPFVVRLCFTAGSDELGVFHTFVYDLDAQKDFVRGIGLRFDVPMTDALHDRHIRFVGQGPGLFAEAVRGITGLRRDPGVKVRKAQIDGVATPPVSEWEEKVGEYLEFIPAWGDFTLSQLCAHGFSIRKRTREGCAWIPAASGGRSAGVGYVGGAGGGVTFGMRDFWQKHPAQIDIRDAEKELAQVTLWLWAPEAPAMDLRPYHDGLGQDSFPKQIEALNITYEDYEPGYGTPYGIARTSEIRLGIVAATPPRQAMVQFADVVRKPAVLVCDADRYLSAAVFGGFWTRPDRSTPARALIEDELNLQLDGYLKEIDQRSWYGFWDYGDFCHTYDTDRHVWRYDIGGYAWDNSELSTDLWLWVSYLRTGRADIFRMAEAMTRHTSEVDVYHIGPRKGLGTRHGVQHWSDSSKQTRISSALFRRPYYFLTGDLRTGDLLRNQLSEGDTWMTNDVNRKLGRGAMPIGTRKAAHWGAMAWGELAAAWLTEIERTQSPQVRDRLLASMRSIADLPLGFFTREATMDLDTGVVTPTGKTIEYEHLTSMFGLPDICFELVQDYADQVPKFADRWAEYGDLYNGSVAQREKALGEALKQAPFRDCHSRCTAFAAWHRKDPELAARAWNEWLNDRSLSQRKALLEIHHFEGPNVLAPIDESHLNTNNAAQYALATLQNLRLIGDFLDAPA